MMYGQLIPVEDSYSQVVASFDFETFSEAGYQWVETPGFFKHGTKTQKRWVQTRNIDLTPTGDGFWEYIKEPTMEWVPPAKKLTSLPGIANTKRGLSVVGVRNYVQHPTFEVISLAYNLKDGRGARLWKFGEPYPLDLFHHVQRRLILEAWNVGFEYQVWNFYCTPKLGWPALELTQLRCCMAKSRASGYPGKLKEAGPVLKLTQQKDPEGDRLISKLTVPRNPTKGNPATRWLPTTAPMDFQKFYAYNVQDIVTEDEASSRIPDLTPHEFEIWQADQRINIRGVGINTRAVEDCIAIIEQCRVKYNSELSQITGGAARASTEVEKILSWLKNKHNIWLPDLSEETVEQYIDMQGYPAEVRRVLRIRQMLAFGSVNKFYAIRAQTTLQGRLHDQYAYYGAHTSLWNGQNVQISNLYKGVFSKPIEVELALKIIALRNLAVLEASYKYDPLEVVASCLRSMFVAAPGHILVSSDYKAIQAVVAACLAGEQWRIDAFRANADIYLESISRLSGVPMAELLEYAEKNGKHHPLRQTGKIAELSGTFGAWINGWKKFGAAEVIGDDNAIKDAILRWRAASPWIVELWGGQTRDKFQPTERPELYGLEGSAIAALMNPGQCFGYRETLFQFDTRSDILYCKPVSGGRLKYHAPRLRRSNRDFACPWELEISYEGWNSSQTKGAIGWQRMKLYGGVLTQNVDSHISREIMANALVRLDTGGHPVVMHTHDEITSEVPIDRASVEYHEKLMTPIEKWARLPDGAPWPIKPSGGWMNESYGKWEFK